MSPLDATNSFCVVTPGHHNTVRGVALPSHAYSANHNALDSWPIRARLAFQNDELCKKSTRFRKAEHRGATIMYSMWEIMYFLTLNRINTLHYTK